MFQQSGRELGQRGFEEAFLVGRRLLWRRGWFGVVGLLWFRLGLGWRFGHLRELLRPGDQTEPQGAGHVLFFNSIGLPECC